MKFEVTSFNTFEVMPWTRFCDTQMDRQGDSRITPPHFVCGGIMTPVYPPPHQLRLWGYKNIHDMFKSKLIAN